MIWTRLPWSRYQQLIEENSGLNLARAKRLEKKYMMAICPFRVTLGTISTTESGYKPFNAEPTNFTQFSKTWLGNEASVVEWLNSATLTQQKSSLNRGLDQGVKHFQVGEVLYGVVLTEKLSTDFTPYAPNAQFINQNVNQKVRLRLYNIPENRNFFNNVFKYQYRFFVVPQSFIPQTLTEDKNPLDDQNRSFFYIEEDMVIRNPKKETIYYDITLVNFAARLKTGTKTSFFLQCGAPGEPYAFPRYQLVNDEPLISLDHSRLNPYPVKYAQVTFYGNVIFNSIVLWGRPITPFEENLDDTFHADKTAYVLNVPQLLFPYQWRGALPDRLTYRKKPEANYYVLAHNFDLIKSYEANEKVKTVYDNFAKATILGGITSDKTKTTPTNPANSRLPFWDTNFAKNWSQFTGDPINTAGNEYFQILDDQHKVVEFVDKFNFTNVPDNLQNLTQLNFFNALVFKTLIEAPLIKTENIKVNIAKIPLIGKIWNFFTLGLMPGFAINNVVAPVIAKNSFYGLINAPLYDYYQNLFLSSKTALAMIPLNVFSDGETDNIGAITGTVGHSMAFAFRLTNKLKTKLVSQTATVRSKRIITTDYLAHRLNANQAGKTYIQDGDYFLVDHESEVLPATTTPDVAGTAGDAYVVDGFNVRFIGNCDYQVKFFDDLENGNLSDNHCVYIARFTSRSNINKMMRDFNNYQKLSDPLLSFKKPFQWPPDQDPIPPFNPPEFEKKLDDIQLGVVAYRSPLKNWIEGKDFSEIFTKLDVWSTDSSSYKFTIIPKVYPGYKVAQIRFRLDGNITVSVNKTIHPVIYLGEYGPLIAPMKANHDYKAQISDIFADESDYIFKDLSIDVNDFKYYSFSYLPIISSFWARQRLPNGLVFEFEKPPARPTVYPAFYIDTAENKYNPTFSETFPGLVFFSKKNSAETGWEFEVTKLGVQLHDHTLSNFTSIKFAFELEDTSGEVNAQAYNNMTGVQFTLKLKLKAYNIRVKYVKI